MRRSNLLVTIASLAISIIAARSQAATISVLLPNSVDQKATVSNEGLLAYEFGYRTVFSDRLSLDLASYFNQYDGLSTSEPGTPFFENSPAPPHLVEPIIFKNLMHGETHGLEIFGTWKVSDRWTISPGYAFEAIHLHISPQSQDTQAVPTTEGVVPAHQAQIRSHFQLMKPLSLESSAYFVDRLRFGSVPSYTRLDTGLLWTAWEGVSVGVFGQNLLKDHHAESNDGNTSDQPSVSKRGGYVQFTWRF